MSVTVQRFFAGDGLGLGNPLQVSEPKNEAPVDWSNRGPKSKQPPKQARQPGEQGKPVTTQGDKKSPSEEVSAPPEGGDLKDNPFDSSKHKPKKLDKKKEGNPGEQGDPNFKTNLWVPAEETRKAFSKWFRENYGGRWYYNPQP